jgi:hypothetical protein
MDIDEAPQMDLDGTDPPSVSQPTQPIPTPAAKAPSSSADNVQESRSPSPALELNSEKQLNAPIDTDGDTVMANVEVQKNQGPIRKSSRLEQKGPQTFPAMTPHRKPKSRNQVKDDVPRHEGTSRTTATRPPQDGSNPAQAIDVDSLFVGRQFFECMLTTELYQADNDISLNVEETALV